MPVVINIAVNLLLGTGLALAVRRSPAMRESLFSWSLFLLIAFEALAFTPVATYVFRFYPQWSMLYWFDPQIFPDLHRWIGWLSLLAIVLNFAAALGAYLIARLGVLSGQFYLWAAPLVVGVVAIGYVGVVYGERVVFVGDYDAFWQGDAVLFVTAPPGWAGVALYLGAAALLIWTRARFQERDPSLL